MRTDTADSVTGATTEIDMEIDLPIEQVWKLISDVGLVGSCSPECVHAAWLDGAGDPPIAGARFEGRNKFPNGHTGTVECVVTEAQSPSVFEWVVLDGEREVGRPGSIWRYELRPGTRAGTTAVRHRFTHGRGMSGLRAEADADPGRADAAVRERLEQLHGYMTVTLHAMVTPAVAAR
ncbi:SRPBCC family protein [Rugosimonospora africana]|uniref:Polyketide cyclase / dehydrase and lipid transport n=1 Tax=Rugosimonospora africana TaxID=556532 RepID=A0A8J3QK58_9ACTN|nr:SRPBCC family protein [Rugosimonospora africana]GIH12464.1 hypothetical protein Raf01_06360 [Rugosimonospora africana]